MSGQVQHLWQDALPKHHPAHDQLAETAPADFDPAEVALQFQTLSREPFRQVIPHLGRVPQGNIMFSPTHLVADVQEFALGFQPQFPENREDNTVGG